MGEVAVAVGRYLAFTNDLDERRAVAAKDAAIRRCRRLWCP